MDQFKLKELLTYDAETGLFHYNTSWGRSIKEGKLAGTKATDDYVKISLLGKMYQAHRLAWLYVHGAWPDGIIDHIDGVVTNNKLENLRVVSLNENAWNSKIPVTNTSGVKGVAWNKEKRKWRAKIGHKRRTLHVGYFNSIEEAEAALREFRENLHGDYANHG